MKLSIVTLTTVTSLLLCSTASYSIGYDQQLHESDKTVTDDTIRQLLGNLKDFLNPVQDIPDGSYSSNSTDSLFYIQINNTQIADLTDYSIDLARADIKNLEFQMGMTFKAVNVGGQYNLTLDNSAVHLDGNGSFVVDITAFQIFANVTFKLNSNNTVEMDDIASDFNIQHTHVDFENLTQNEELSDFLNEFINQYIDECATAMKPVVAEIVRQRLIPLGNFVVMGLTVDDLIDFINSLV